jgi:CRISPR-associated protein Csx10
MARIRLQITALAPLSFSARRGTTSAFTNTLNYLPGTALRGAAAAHYLRNIGEPTDEHFQNLFVNDAILFANLYPQRRDNQGVSQTLPSTARSCKAHRGFLEDSSVDDKTHGVGDILMRAAAFAMRGDKEMLKAVARCPQCSQPTHPFSGFYERAAVAEPVYCQVDVYKRHLPHVGINRRTQTAEQGVLYAQEVINEARREKSNEPYRPQCFSGDLIVQQQHVEFVKHTLLAKGAILWVGESRSRGLGRVQVSVCASTATDDDTKLKGRIAAFNRQFAEQRRTLAERTYIPLTLQSDAIMQDAFMRPKTHLEAADLARAVGPASGQSLLSLRPVYASVGTRLVQSWNVASGYPKPDEVAIRMGSVFLFEAPEAIRDDLARSLLALQEGGVGKRRSEGFGRLSVCDPFHTEVKELWQTT